MIIRKLKKWCAAVIAISFTSAAFSQGVSLTPVLVGSAGGFTNTGTFSISSSVGESVITTQSAPGLFLTQGFQQPSSSTTLALTATFSAFNSTCSGANNGYGIAQVMSGKAPYTYQWMPIGGSKTSSSMSDTSGFLPPGTYTVTVTDANGFAVTDSVIVAESSENCGIVLYHGLTPNGDGHNDTWVIDFIDLYDNNVAIFNRWGSRVWHGSNYDNNNVVWNGTAEGSGQALPDGTYYYVITYNNKTVTGWVELSH
jgi:gliding motility-associated-like protein